MLHRQRNDVRNQRRRNVARRNCLRWRTNSNTDSQTMPSGSKTCIAPTATRPPSNNARTTEQDSFCRSNTSGRFEQAVLRCTRRRTRGHGTSDNTETCQDDLGLVLAGTQCRGARRSTNIQHKAKRRVPGITAYNFDKDARRCRNCFRNKAHESNCCHQRHRNGYTQPHQTLRSRRSNSPSYVHPHSCNPGTTRGLERLHSGCKPGDLPQHSLLRNLDRCDRWPGCNGDRDRDNGQPRPCNVGTTEPTVALHKTCNREPQRPCSLLRIVDTHARCDMICTRLGRGPWIRHTTSRRLSDRHASLHISLGTIPAGKPCNRAARHLHDIQIGPACEVDDA